MWAGFVLCQGYVPENVQQIETAHTEQRIHIQKSVFPGG